MLDACGRSADPVEIAEAAEVLARGDIQGWTYFWKVLYHQGDTSELAILLLPLLWDVAKRSGAVDWQVFALAASVSLAAHDAGMQQGESFRGFLAELTCEGATEERSNDQRGGLRARGVLACLAALDELWAYARFILEFDPEEAEDVVAGILDG